MQCPACSAELERSLYEGLPVFCCAGCQGYLVATRRAADIARVREKSPDLLQQEATVADALDSAEVLRCPRCRRQMVKEFRKGADAFHINTCRDCQLIWFDAGELARWQLAYQSTGRSQEAASLQEKHRQMDPAAKREFEENLARLPESEGTLQSAVGEAFKESLWSLMCGIWRR